jgi:hypothetical protein
MMSFLY